MGEIMKKVILSIFVLFVLIVTSFAQTGKFEPARIYKAMDKGRQGKHLKIGVIGGSITEGYAASTADKRWANLMADWWQTTFPDSTVELINAGWGGTGSDIGVHRAYDDLLKQNPDFVVIEFAVNDVEGDLAEKMMEGLVQQILSAENHPGVMILTLKMEDGTTAQASHKLVADYYGIPMVSFADKIDDRVAADGVDLNSIFVDGLHPNDVGMAYVADFIKEKLDSLYSTLPAHDSLPAIDTVLPTPLVTDTYSHTYQFFSDNIIPYANSGWKIASSGWISENAGDQIDFQVIGNAFSLIFTQNDDANRGKAEVWIDDGEKKIIDAWMNEDWGTRYAFTLIQEGLSDGNHIVHIKNIDQSSVSGHYVHIARLLTAGHVGSAAPFAITESTQKGVVGRTSEFNGYKSYDPDGEEITSYNWTIESKPDGSTAVIQKADEIIASFKPDVAGNYTIKLVVSSGINESVPAYKALSVRAFNTPPVAVAGNDTISALDKFFKFDGSKSYDADGDALTYKWALESWPEGSTTDLLKADSEKPQCKFYIAGDYVFSLVVYDSLDYSNQSFITVTAKEGYTGIKKTQSDDKSLKIFPNPATNKVSVEFYPENNQEVKIEVYSIIGTKVAEFKPQNTGPGSNTFTFDLHDYASESGIYLIKVKSGQYSRIAKLTLN